MNYSVVKIQFEINKQHVQTPLREFTACCHEQESRRIRKLRSFIIKFPSRLSVTFHLPAVDCCRQIHEAENFF